MKFWVFFFFLLFSLGKKKKKEKKKATPWNGMRSRAVEDSKEGISGRKMRQSRPSTSAISLPTSLPFSPPRFPHRPMSHVWSEGDVLFLTAKSTRSHMSSAAPCGWLISWKTNHVFIIEIKHFLSNFHPSPAGQDLRKWRRCNQPPSWGVLGAFVNLGLEGSKLKLYFIIKEGRAGRLLAGSAINHYNFRLLGYLLGHI